ncbi:MAG: hypothetical protein HDQ93_01295 [Desulfovibrio sp.]|nr:hypothetical protein [Desulfovibrio sp.]
MSQPTIAISGREAKNPVAKATSKGASSAKGASFAAVMDRERQAQGSSVKQGSEASKNIQGSAKRTTAAPSAGIPLRGTILAGRTPNDMLRMQNFTTAGLTGAATPNMGKSLSSATNLRTIAAADNGRGFALARTDFIRTAPRADKTARATSARKRQVSDETRLGKLSAKFESGSDGIAAIGYDSTGGTSYGKYQIASKVGSMKSFLAFLDNEAPDLASRLRQAGPANTGSRRGGMPGEWRAIAKEQPERFEQLQEAYIHESHYKPALSAIAENTGIDTSNLSAAMREVIWSTAVQHGPAGAARIFAKADSMSGKARSDSYEKKLIANVYNVRAGQFGSSTPQVREAVRNRFREERQLALNMLKNGDAA